MSGLKQIYNWTLDSQSYSCDSKVCFSNAVLYTVWF